MPSKLVADWFSDLSRAWKKDAEFDRYLEATYGAQVEAALAGGLTEWTETAEGSLGLILLLDQLPRNIFRGTPRMYAGDGRAVELVQAMLRDGRDRQLTNEQRAFAYMPLMHSEDRAVQALCEAQFAALAQQAPETCGHYPQHALSHRVIVDRFGRFPHRNEILGRESTAEEIDFLKQPNSSF